MAKKKNSGLVRNVLRTNPQENLHLAGELGIPPPGRTTRSTRKSRRRPARRLPTWKSENQFMAQVCTHLAFHFPDLLIFHVPNENSQHQPGVVGGIPDVVVLAPNGRAMFLELKATSANGTEGEISEEQSQIINRLRSLGFTVWVVLDDLDLCVKLVGNWYEELQTI